jgi:ABC-2 type transport system ATP-binding protein
MMLTTHRLTKKYGSATVLSDVSIHIKKGDVYGLIGRNGAGKTTLFKLIMGLSKRTSGDISIANSKNLNAARSKIGFMLGQPFFPYASARQNIEFYRTTKGIRNKKETERVLRLVDLWGVKKPFRTFSMGMKQRLGIANAMLGAPPFIILDEPVNGLDPQGVADIRNMVKKINEETGTTFIISSHILAELDLVATKFGFIEQGRLLQEISYEELHEKMKTKTLLEVSDIEKSLYVLNAAGIDVATVGKEGTLEEYFFNLIGGLR